MKILHCIPTVWSGSGGPPRSLAAIVSAVSLAEPDVEIHVLSTNYGLTDEWEEQLRSLMGAARLHLAAQMGFHTRAISPGMIAWLFKHGRSVDVVLIHSLFHPTSTMCMLVCRVLRLPYLVMPHGSLSPYTFASGKRRSKRLWWHGVERRLVNAARGIICTSTGESGKIARLKLRAPLFIMPLPVQPALIEPGPRLAPIVLYLSRLDRKKNVHILIDAFSRVLREEPRARLIIAGQGHDGYDAQLKEQVAAEGLAGSIEFVGFVEGEAKSQLFRDASVFVLPSSEENFGIAIFEAMAARLPVIVSHGVDLSEDIQAAGAGLVVEPDPVVLADAVLHILRNDSEASAMGNRGWRFVQDALAPVDVGAHLLRICRKVAPARSASPGHR